MRTSEFILTYLQVTSFHQFPRLFFLEISTFNYLGYYRGSDDLSNKLERFQTIRGILRMTSKRKA